jgi:hypothetical protein
MPAPKTPTASERNYLERAAWPLAKNRAKEKGCQLVSVSGAITDRSPEGDILAQVGWNVTGKATFRMMDERGLSRTFSEPIECQSDQLVNMER